MTLQTVDRGCLIPYPILLIRSGAEASPLFIMDLTEENFKKVNAFDLEMVVRVPVAGSHFPTFCHETRYQVVGRINGLGEPKFYPSVGMPLFKGFVGVGGRLKVEWLLWNKEVVLEPMKKDSVEPI